MAINYRTHFAYRIDLWDADGENVIDTWLVSRTLKSRWRPTWLRASAGLGTNHIAPRYASNRRQSPDAAWDIWMTSPTWRALGQVVLVYFAVGGAAVTAQDTQPGRATFAEMITFARLASVPASV